MLVSRDTVLQRLGLDESNVDRVDVLIEWIQDRAELLIGRKLEQAEFTWYLDGTGSNRIVLPVAPITELTALYIDTSREFTDAESTDDYYTNMDNGIITLYNTTTPRMPIVVKVEATAGYTEDTLPASLKFAFIEAIKWNLSRWNDGYFGRTNQSTPDGIQVGYEMVLPMGVQRVFESYREVHI
jgi:hypothetical protein